MVKWWIVVARFDDEHNRRRRIVLRWDPLFRRLLICPLGMRASVVRQGERQEMVYPTPNACGTACLQ